MQHGSMLRALVHDTSLGGLMIRQGRASNQWFYLLWSPLLVAYCTWRGLQCVVRHSFIPGSWSAWIAPVQALLLLLDDVLVGSTGWHARLLILHRSCFYSIWHSFTRRGRWQVLFNYNPGSSRISGVLTDGSDMAYLISSTLAVISRNMLGWLSWYTSMQCWATWSEWMEVWYPISCWRSCESRGIELCAR